LCARFVSYIKPLDSALKDFKVRANNVEIDGAREMYQRAVGAHPDQSGFVSKDSARSKSLRLFQYPEMSFHIHWKPLLYQ
jgi:hypothetical protein